jgi:WD40 repeat protein
VFASGSDDATARLWRPPGAGCAAWRCDAVLRHSAPVLALCFASGGALVTAAGGSAFLWRDRRCVRAFRAGAPLRALALCDATSELVAAASDASLRIFDLFSGALLRILRREGGAPAAALALHSPARLLATAGFDGLQVVDAQQGRPLPWRFGAHAATAVAITAGAVAWVGEADGTLRSYDLRTGRCLAELTRLHPRATVALHAPPGAGAPALPLLRSADDPLLCFSDK